MDLKLNILDQTLIPDNCTVKQTLEHTITLAKLADTLGYHRFWLAEHHVSSNFVSCSPEILIARLAHETQRVRLGSGGVMLPHYSPFKVAENFNLLSAMYPGRIDLGIGRAFGTDAKVADALAYDHSADRDNFSEKLQAVCSLINTNPEQPEEIVAGPIPEIPPELWLLGSSNNGAELAAEKGLSYVFAHFISPEKSLPALTYYQQNFKPTDFQASPESGLGVMAYCADSEEEARNLALCRTLWLMKLSQGSRIPFPSVTEVVNFSVTAHERQILEELDKGVVYGTATQLRNKLLDLAEQHSVQEMTVLSNCHDFDDRLRSYTLLARAFNL
ncbi:MAG: LLM class flavin-dependent oxidoreductase [Pseudomonadales bacterium]|nr:LLM class flavin-dependent oxidoreductase [Pseudomonadales bacterium]